jgi:hypothetical protein
VPSSSRYLLRRLEILDHEWERDIESGTIGGHAEPSGGRACRETCGVQPAAQRKGSRLPATREGQPELVPGSSFGNDMMAEKSRGFGVSRTRRFSGLRRRDG